MARARSPRPWAQALLQFWFHRLNGKQRFARDDGIDRMIRQRFVPVLQAMAGQPAASFLRDRDTARAAILLFDQVPRNAFRDAARAFAYDAKARTLVRGALARGRLRGLSAEERQFLLMPLMHSESRADQRDSVIHFTRLGSASVRRFAVQHARVVARFGRFPHRNAILGRKTTAAERRAIAAGNHW